MSVGSSGKQTQIIAELKRKLRELKRLERSIRFGVSRGSSIPPGQKLVWDRFFSTKGGVKEGIRYPIEQLAEMDREAFKGVIEEFFYHVYFEHYRANGLRLEDVHDPNLLALLDLPPYASAQDIKRRFRQLAMKYHPDHGGDSQQFIELMELYEKLQAD